MQRDFHTSYQSRLNCFRISEKFTAVLSSSLHPFVFQMQKWNFSPWEVIFILFPWSKVSTGIGRRQVTKLFSLTLLFSFPRFSESEQSKYLKRFEVVKKKKLQQFRDNNTLAPDKVCHLDCVGKGLSFSSELLSVPPDFGV